MNSTLRPRLRTLLLSLAAHCICRRRLKGWRKRLLFWQEQQQSHIAKGHPYTDGINLWLLQSITLPPLYNWSYLLGVTFSFQFTLDRMNQEPCNMHFNKLHRWFWCTPKFEKHALLNMAVLGPNNSLRAKVPILNLQGILAADRVVFVTGNCPQFQGHALLKVTVPTSTWSMANNWLKQGCKGPTSRLKLGQL